MGREGSIESQQKTDFFVLNPCLIGLKRYLECIKIYLFVALFDFTSLYCLLFILRSMASDLYLDLDFEIFLVRGHTMSDFQCHYCNANN